MQEFHCLGLGCAIIVKTETAMSEQSHHFENVGKLVQGSSESLQMLAILQQLILLFLCTCPLTTVPGNIAIDFKKFQWKSIPIWGNGGTRGPKPKALETM